MPDELPQEIHDTFRSAKAKHQARGFGGKFVKKETSYESVQPIQNTNPLFSVSNSISDSKGDPPLVNASFKVTNPVTYLKNWWKRLIGNEGITIKIKPLTAFLIVGLFISGGITLNLINRITNLTPIGKYAPAIGSTFLIDAAFTGTIETNQKGAYYLITNGGDVLTLQNPDNDSLVLYTGKKVLINGKYNSDIRYLYVEEIKELN